MQNIVYERKQNGEVFFSLLTVTCFCFGNRPANGLVTEQPQYSVVVCIFHILQNTEIQLISNDLRLIFTCSLLLASPCIFQCHRHTFACRNTRRSSHARLLDIRCSQYSVFGLSYRFCQYHTHGRYGIGMDSHSHIHGTYRQLVPSNRTGHIRFPCHLATR